ncbi:MAG: pyrroline-5-carboxylate reductase [Anaerolineae bacterium]|nr:pyrroline-5-carboxylate reductase [Anaerolineae bacterium]MCA9890563.1 pyrroline-5-carboxylate reductase [Anaerolineae bacterium]MCB9459514.1 pyrroline-5-carboxylate reductase [Anaerolineaceae bacterium]
MALKGTRIAFIGSGVMGRAIISGLLSKGLVEPELIIAADPDMAAMQTVQANNGIAVTRDNLEAVAGAQILVLCVKPQNMGMVLDGLRGHVAHVELAISIAAGVTLKTIEEGLALTHVVRAMPNTPGQIGEGVSVWTNTPEVTDEQKKQAQEILEAMGQAIHVHDEKYLDMATALTGSGPAYVFMFIEALIDAGVRMGFSRDIATTLAMQLVKGSTDFLAQSGAHPTVLRNQVTSPGGTTAAALYELDKGNFRTTISDAIWAAYQRSIELGKD